MSDRQDTGIYRRAAVLGGLVGAGLLLTGTTEPMDSDNTETADESATDQYRSAELEIDTRVIEIPAGQRLLTVVTVEEWNDDELLMCENVSERSPLHVDSVSERMSPPHQQRINAMDGEWARVSTAAPADGNATVQLEGYASILDEAIIGEVRGCE